MVENTVGKGQIAHYEQFVLFQQCFQKTCTALLQTHKKTLGFVLEGVKDLSKLKVSNLARQQMKYSSNNGIFQRELETLFK